MSQRIVLFDVKIGHLNSERKATSVLIGPQISDPLRPARLAELVTSGIMVGPGR